MLQNCLFFLFNLEFNSSSANRGPLCHFLGLTKRTLVSWMKNGQLTIPRITPLPISALLLSKEDTSVLNKPWANSAS